MAGSGSSPSGGSRSYKGNARMNFFLFSMTVMLGGGFFGGVAATKRAMQGPEWVQRMFGIQLPPQQVVAAPLKAPVTPAVAPTPPPPSAPVTPPPSNQAVATPNTGTSTPPPPPSASDAQGFVGSWEITDDVQAGDGTPTKIHSGYIFNADGTGEFNTNGKKLYDLRWNLSGEYLTITYDNEQAPQGDDGAIRMRWSVTPDRSLLTLAPQNGKDARATLYSVPDGVYHKK